MFLPQFFFPEKAGKDYAASPYIERLKAHRDQLTVFSGVSHPGVTGGHAAEKISVRPKHRIVLLHLLHPLQDRSGHRIVLRVRREDQGDVAVILNRFRCRGTPASLAEGILQREIERENVA